MIRPSISVVAPLYNEADNVERFVAELLAVLRPLGEPFEIVLVDDGSSDDTWRRIQDAARREPALRGLSLMRNFGHQGALLAGLAQATGRAVISMDGDLQHPPEVIPELLAAWREGVRIVHTRRLDSRETGWFKRWTSRAFYRVFSALSGFDLPPGSSDFRLLDRDRRSTPSSPCASPSPSLRLAHRPGSASATVTFGARDRHAGGSKRSRLRRHVAALGPGPVSFSTVPLRLGIWAGLATSALAFAEILYILVQVARGETVPGWASVLTLVSFMFGVLFILLGILGTYLASIHQAIRNRPAYPGGPHRGRARRRRTCAGLGLSEPERGVSAPARFVAVGLSNSLLSFVAFRAGVELLPRVGGRAAAAQALAYAAGILWSFTWNRRWTFGDRGPLTRPLAAFAATQGALLALTSGALGLAVDVLGAPATPAWLAVMAGATLLNYLAQRHLVFAAR